MCISKKNKCKNKSNSFGQSELVHIDRTLHIANNDISMQLSKQEFMVLKLLADNIGCIIRREDIEICLGSNNISEHGINNIIHRLRKYIELDNSIKIDTIRGVGHKMTEVDLCLR